MIIKEETLEKIEKITSTDYGRIKVEEDKYLILPVNTEVLIDDLLYEISYLEEKIEDLENREEYNPNDEYNPEDYI